MLRNFGYIFMKKYTKVLVVGAGMFGSVVAERIANDSGIPVTVLDKRAHIGGNCWSEYVRLLALNTINTVRISSIHPMPSSMNISPSLCLLTHTDIRYIRHARAVFIPCPLT